MDSIFRDFVAVVTPLMQPQFVADGFPQTVSHYTDFAGLHGILQSGKLWATYTQTMNDASEQRYGDNVLRQYISQLSDLEMARALRSTMDSDPASTYAACFCESSNILNMWLTYANRGGGYCLEFNSAGLLFGPSAGLPGRFSLRMNYGEDLSPAIRDVLDYAADHSRLSQLHLKVSVLWMKLLGLRFKHPAFELEREWRIVIQNPDISQLKFRAGPTEVRPYVEFLPTAQVEQPNLPLRKIVFGPTLRQDGVMIDTIELMLSRFGYHDVSIESCGIPYRL